MAMGHGMFIRLALILASALLSGCAALPFATLIPIMGPAYQGYVVWKSGEATKYYAFDLDTTYRAVVRTSDKLKLKATVIKSSRQEGYTLETKGNARMEIKISPIEMNVTTVVIRIPMFGDKHYVELIYNLVDDNLPKKMAMAKTGEAQRARTGMDRSRRR